MFLLSLSVLPVDGALAVERPKAAVQALRVDVVDVERPGGLHVAVPPPLRGLLVQPLLHAVERAALAAGPYYTHDTIYHIALYIIYYNVIIYYIYIYI